MMLTRRGRAAARPGPLLCLGTWRRGGERWGKGNVGAGEALRCKLVPRAAAPAFPAPTGLRKHLGCRRASSRRRPTRLVLPDDADRGGRGLSRAATCSDACQRLCCALLALFVPWDPLRRHTSAEHFVRAGLFLRAALLVDTSVRSSGGAFCEPWTLDSLTRLADQGGGGRAPVEPDRAAASLVGRLCGLAGRSRGSRRLVCVFAARSTCSNLSEKRSGATASAADPGRRLSRLARGVGDVADSLRGDSAPLLALLVGERGRTPSFALWGPSGSPDDPCRREQGTGPQP